MVSGCCIRIRYRRQERQLRNRKPVQSFRSHKLALLHIRKEQVLRNRMLALQRIRKEQLLRSHRLAQQHNRCRIRHNHAFRTGEPEGHLSCHSHCHIRCRNRKERQPFRSHMLALLHNRKERELRSHRLAR